MVEAHFLTMVEEPPQRISSQWWKSLPSQWLRSLSSQWLGSLPSQWLRNRLTMVEAASVTMV